VVTAVFAAGVSASAADPAIAAYLLSMTGVLGMPVTNLRARTN
jgi:hypothetical protein